MQRISRETLKDLERMFSEYTTVAIKIGINLKRGYYRLYSDTVSWAFIDNYVVEDIEKLLKWCNFNRTNTYLSPVEFTGYELTILHGLLSLKGLPKEK